MGINVPAYANYPSDRADVKIRLAFIGSPIYGKGVDILIRAFRRITSRHLILDIYGHEETESNSYVNQIKTLASTDSRIHFQGSFQIEKKAAVYQRLDVLVLPSRTPETFSLVAHEALSVGKPVIASRIGAIPEAVIDNVNGFLFDPGNIDELANIISRIEDTPEVLNKLECPGPTRIVSEDEHVKQMADLYKDLVASENLSEG